jgi:predicted permease
VALGETRASLARQLLTESLLLSVTGTSAGLLVATLGSRFLVNQLSTSTDTAFLDMSIDTRMVMFAVAITVLTTLVFGTVPAVRASSVNPIDALKDQERTAGPHAHGRLSSWFVIAQVALSFVLLVAAGLFVQTFTEIATRPLGFQPEQVTIVTMDSGRTGIAPDARLPEFERARDAVRAVPGVAEAALSFITPFTGGFTPPLNISGVPAFEGRLSGNLVSEGWFRTFGTPVIAGRDLSDRDVKGTPRVAVVNQAFASRFFPGASPLGQTISLYPGGARAMPPMTIVGIVGDAVYSSLRGPAPPTWYSPLSQFDVPEFTTQISFLQLAVRSRTSSPVASREVAAAIGTVNPALALTFRPLSDYVDAARNQERLVALLAGSFGTLGLLLAGLGLYGITAYAVAVRRSEIGIRMALGAAAGRMMQLVLIRVAILVATGTIAGLALSLWLSRFVASLLYGVQPHDPATLLGAFIVLASVGLVAGAIPARRAARTNPATVLRES